MDLGNAVSELETFVLNLGDLWQVTAWLLRNKTAKLGKFTNYYVICLPRWGSFIRMTQFEQYTK